MRLPGRRAEGQIPDRLLADTLAGRSRVTVLRGEPGVGKSALLGYLSGRAADRHVATAAGVEPEIELAHSDPHQLCAGLHAGAFERLAVAQTAGVAAVGGWPHAAILPGQSPILSPEPANFFNSARNPAFARLSTVC